MASFPAVFMVTVCLLLLGPGACTPSPTPLMTMSNRKVLVAAEDPPLAWNAAGAIPVGSAKNNGSSGEEVVEYEAELRGVPSGPDPLHHHGSTPKKPDNRKNLPSAP